MSLLVVVFDDPPGGQTKRTNLLTSQLPVSPYRIKDNSAPSKAHTARLRATSIPTGFLALCQAAACLHGIHKSRSARVKRRLGNYLANRLFLLCRTSIKTE